MNSGRRRREPAQGFKRSVTALCVGAAVSTIVSLTPHVVMAQATDTSFAVSRNAVIDISLRSGRLIVRGGDRSSAELRTSRTDYRLRSAGVGVTLAIGTESGRNTRSSSSRGDVQLLVPRGVKLVVNGMTGDVSVSDVDGDVEVQVLSGDIEVRSLGGRAILSTLSGDVRVNEVAGDLRLTTVSGDITASAVRGDLDVNTTSGDVVVNAGQVRRLQFNSVSGDLTLEGTLVADARLQLTTHSGDVMLRLPENAGGQLEVSTFNGTVSGGTMTLLPGTVGTRRDRSATLYEFGGGGSARITVSTFNGDITLSRGARRRDQ